MSAGVTEADLRWLRNMASKRGRLIFTVVLLVGTAVCFGVGITNLVLASRYASQAGTDLWHVFLDDVGSYRGDALYSGYHVKAIDRFLVGAVETAMALVVPLIGILQHVASRRAERILESLGEGQNSAGAHLTPRSG